MDAEKTDKEKKYVGKGVKVLGIIALIGFTILSYIYGGQGSSYLDDLAENGNIKQVKVVDKSIKEHEKGTKYYVEFKIEDGITYKTLTNKEEFNVVEKGKDYKAYYNGDQVSTFNPNNMNNLITKEQWDIAKNKESKFIK